MITPGSFYAAHISRRTLVGGLAASFASLPALTRANDGLKGGPSSDEPDDEVSAELAELGVVSDDTYISPQFGYEIHWPRPWQVDPIEPGETSEAEAFDTIYLSWMDGDETLAMIDLTGIAANPRDARTFFQTMQTEETLNDLLYNKYDVTLVTSASGSDALEMVLYGTESANPDSAVVMLCAYRMISDEVMTLASTIIVDEALIEDVLSAYLGDIEVDGAPIMQALSAPDVLDALSALETSPTTRR